jgi:predicted TIM-barrel fold metal-dependent hydrolase
VTDSKYAESALEPRLPIIDAHHHLWPDGHYQRADLIRDVTAGHNIVETVFIDCSASYRTSGPAEFAPVGETEWAMTQRGGAGVIAGIVSHVDMYLGSRAAEVIEAHLAAGGEVFKGVRHNVAWDRHPDTNNALRGAPQYALLDPTFQAGVAELDRRSLIFETWVYFNQLGDVAQLAGRFPGLSIILNHLGGPAVNGPYAGHRPEMLEEWRRGLQNVASHENVYLKLGGIGYRSFIEDSVMAGPKSSEWLADYWRPEIRFCVETFGPSRCMFESNYPEDRLLCDYVVLWNTFKRVSSDLSAGERSELFELTARRAYSL